MARTYKQRPYRQRLILSGEQGNHRNFATVTENTSVTLMPRFCIEVFPEMNSCTYARADVIYPSPV